MNRICRILFTDMVELQNGIVLSLLFHLKRFLLIVLLTKRCLLFHLFLFILVNTTCCERIQILTNQTSSPISTFQPSVIGTYKRMDKTVYHQTAWQKVDNANLYLVKHSDTIKVPFGSEPEVKIVQNPNYWKVIALNDLKLLLNDGNKEPRPNATSGDIKVNSNCDEQCPNMCKNGSKFDVHKLILSGSSSVYISDSSISFACEDRPCAKNHDFTTLLLVLKSPTDWTVPSNMKTATFSAESNITKPSEPTTIETNGPPNEVPFGGTKSATVSFALFLVLGFISMASTLQA